MRSHFAMAIAAAVSVMASAGCATQSTPTSARLERVDAPTLERVRAVLAKAIGRPQFELGPEDLATSSTISVLPRPLGPYDTRSPELPLVFDIKMIDGQCHLVAQGDGKMYPLEGVGCKPT
jgi:hypothetical protein